METTTDTRSGLANLGALARSLIDRQRQRVVVYIGLLLAQSVLQGAGLLLLVPLLAVVGVTETGGAQAEPLSRFFFETLNLPPSLPLILGLFVGLVALREAVGYAVTVQNSLLRLR